jgi:hypothetical protein
MIIFKHNGNSTEFCRSPHAQSLSGADHPRKRVTASG